MGESPLAPLIQIDTFSYTMTKHPDQKQRLEKYQVKVDLEFSSITPKAAREFHDALIAPNAIVDPKGEIKWGTNKNKYRTSFYLKDRTLYPSS
jgi:type IV pilus assembly protein PilM